MGSQPRIGRGQHKPATGHIISSRGRRAVKASNLPHLALDSRPPNRIQKIPNPNLENPRYTALMYAASWGYAEICDVLLDKVARTSGHFSGTLVSLGFAGNVWRPPRPSCLKTWPFRGTRTLSRFSKKGPTLLETLNIAIPARARASERETAHWVHPPKGEIFL